MLNKHKIIHELQKIVPTIFSDVLQERIWAHNVWVWLGKHEQIARDIAQHMSASNFMPRWLEPLANIYTLSAYSKSYILISVDGSQIYPDRHQGIGCCLINIGVVEFIYESITSHVNLESIPYVFSAAEFLREDQTITAESVDCKRTELEWQVGLERVQKIEQQQPVIVLYDGSLMCWHLDKKKDTEEKFQFLARYLDIQQQLYECKSITGSFISLPKSRELVALIKAGYEQNTLSIDAQQTEHNYVFKCSLHSTDAEVMADLLPIFSRSAIFEHHSSLIKYYAQEIRPCFVYINNGTEIVRLEFPYWISQNKEALDLLLSVVIDQCIKGYGYPIALAEAHEQAVIKAPDREFFYSLLHTMSLQHNKEYTQSQKSLKKRLVSI